MIHRAFVDKCFFQIFSLFFKALPISGLAGCSKASSSWAIGFFQCPVGWRRRGGAPFFWGAALRRCCGLESGFSGCGWSGRGAVRGSPLLLAQVGVQVCEGTGFVRIGPVELVLKELLEQGAKVRAGCVAEGHKVAALQEGARAFLRDLESLGAFEQPGAGGEVGCFGGAACRVGLRDADE